MIFINQFHAHGSRYILPTRQTHREPPQQISLRENCWIFLRFGGLGLQLLDRQRRQILGYLRKLRQESKRIDQGCIDFVRGLNSCSPYILDRPPDVKEQAPINGPLLREFAESIQTPVLNACENKKSTIESTLDLIWRCLCWVVTTLQFRIQTIDGSHH